LSCCTGKRQINRGREQKKITIWGEEGGRRSEKKKLTPTPELKITHI